MLRVDGLEAVGQRCAVQMGGHRVHELAATFARAPVDWDDGHAAQCTRQQREGVYTHNGVQWDLIDTPGTYSLLPLSPDERVAAEAVMGLNGEATPDLIVAVLDATNISRALYFLSIIRVADEHDAWHGVSAGQPVAAGVAAWFGGGMVV